MNCRQVQSKLVLLLDGQLHRKQEHALYEHIKSCPECQRALHLLKGQVKLLEGAGRFSPPGDLWNAIENQLPEKKAPTWHMPGLLVSRPAALATAALVLVAVLVGILWHQHPGNAPVDVSRPVVALTETEELDTLVSAHRRLELGNPLSGGPGIIALVADENNGTLIY